MKRHRTTSFSTGRRGPRAGTILRLRGGAALGRAIGLAVCLLLARGVANAEVKLAKVFGSNMVIQRGQPVDVWGTADTNAAVLVCLGAQSVRTVAGADGRWRVTFKPLATGGPYKLAAAAGGASVVLTNILGGDVWLCSGQSNMQMPVREADPREQQAALAALAGLHHLRLCLVPKTPAAKPLTDPDIAWALCTTNSVRDFSAVAIFFGHELLRDPALAKIPVGLVDSSFGGTTCEGWIPGPGLAGFATNDLHDSMFGIKPASLYNGMIAPLGRTRFKGVLWYQGESNSAHPATYPALLATMISEWRAQFGQPDLPFFIVQLPEYANLWEGYYWPWIREMQARAVAGITNAALVVGIRTTDGFNLHPREKLEIGRRAALQARKVAYHESLAASGPVFESATVEGPAVRVRFDTDHHGLASSLGSEVAGFAVAGADGEYHFARARIEGETVLVESEEVPRPQTVRYAWGAMPTATLINKAGLPAAPFRTDTFPCANVEIQKQRASRRVATAAYELVVDANGTVTSLVVNGAQFISNEAGTAGGSSIPGFWGPRSLTDIRESGPQSLACSDGEVTLLMKFGEKSSEWTILNHGKEAITFQLALSPFVKTSGAIADGRLTLARGAAVLETEGFETITNTSTGALLGASIKAGDQKTLFLK